MKIEFNFSKLRGKIREVYGSEAAFAKAVGRSRVMMSNYLTGKCSIDPREIYKWCELLGIEQAEIGAYFFAK